MLDDESGFGNDGVFTIAFAMMTSPEDPAVEDDQAVPGAGNCFCAATASVA